MPGFLGDPFDGPVTAATLHNIAQARRLCAELAAVGIAEVHLQFYGDGGDAHIDGIHYIDAKGKPVCGGDFDGLVEIVLFNDAVNVQHGGFADDEGGGGEASLYVEDRQIAVDVHYYYQETRTTPTETYSL